MFRLFKKKKYLDFEEVRKLWLQRLRVLGNSEDCIESNRNLWKQNTDFFGLFLNRR